MYFWKKLLKAYHENVVATADIIAGAGFSTDGFLYFRCWLILMGPKVLEMAIESPNKLPELIDFKVSRETSAENLLYVSNDAYAMALGVDNYDEIWDETYGKLKERCPGIHYDDMKNHNMGGQTIDWDKYEDHFPKLVAECRKGK